VCRILCSCVIITIF